MSRLHLVGVEGVAEEDLAAVLTSSKSNYPTEEIDLDEESAARSALGVYGISVASQLSGVGPQTLRLYETRGLLAPTRSEGGTRRYSEDDLARLRRIAELLSDGVNLAGIAQIFDLEARNAQLELTNAQLMTSAGGRKAVRAGDGK